MMASGILVNNAAAMREPQWYTSPRTSAMGTPRLTVMRSTELINVSAYTNSCITNVNVKTTTVKMPGRMRRGATRKITASRHRYDHRDDHNGDDHEQGVRHPT